MLEFCVLASGSRANALYVGTSEYRVLIDCGLSAREAARRLALVGIAADTINALIVTHEHSDHISGVAKFCERHSATLYANAGTISGARFSAKEPQESYIFCTGHSFTVGNITFEPFSITHDAADPVGFRISSGGVAVVLAADLGQITNLVREKVRGIDALILEANHDPGMLQTAPYPWSLKQRISSRMGHLSNEAAGALLEELSSNASSSADRALHYVIAAHISEKSNNPQLAVQALQSGWNRGCGRYLPEFSAASPREPSPMYRLF